MQNITISPDKNTITVVDTTHKFHPGEKHTCKTCSLFRECCQLQETVANEFPFPCILENRPDNKFGNFQME